MIGILNIHVHAIKLHTLLTFFGLLFTTTTKRQKPKKL